MGAPRTQRVLRELELDAAVLSSIPSVLDAAGHWPRWEMWPGQNPHVLDPPLCCAWPDREPVLLLPNYFGPYADAARIDVDVVPSYSFTETIDKLAETVRAVSARIGTRVGRFGYEPATLPMATWNAVDRAVSVGQWVDVTSSLERARSVKEETEIEAIRRAAGVADTVQKVVKEQAQAGLREIDLASKALSKAWMEAGRRFPILIQLKSGASTAVRGQWHPGDRIIEEGDVICTDNAPWLDGFWGDSCNGIVVGEPTRRHQEIFAIVNEALHAGIDAARPGVEARSVDQACRRVVEGAGFAYPHHSGHGIGFTRAEPPWIVPNSTDILAAGNVIALEPGIYVEGWGGFRNEHVIAVRDGTPEVLTRFKHRL